MGVRNAGLAIKEARLKAGLTQEQLSEGICSVQSLSRIENNTAGVSPSTFQALMAHAGAPCEAFPTFANKTDFDCFYTLKRARFYLDAWQLREAYEELEKIENMKWADNKFYYQEWALLHCKLQFRSYCGNHEQILQDLISALKITRPDFTITDFRSLLLSITEIELFISLAQEYLYTNHLSECMIICEQIASYLENSEMTFLEKERLLAEHAIVFSKYCIAIKNYQTALKTANFYRHEMVINGVNALLYELTFLTGLGYHFTNNAEQAFFYFKTAFYSSHAIYSIYATACYSYWSDTLDTPLSLDTTELHPIPFSAYAQKKIIYSLSLHDGTYDLYSPSVITLGKLIYTLRTEQKLAQSMLCQGLCSKSKLSKIENELLQPSIPLAEALLQRLGISDRVFTFSGDDLESEFYDLKFKLIHFSRKKHSEDQLLMNRFEQISQSHNPLILQRYLFEKAIRIEDATLSYNLLLDALHITLPNFEITNIENYRLSWTELCILNNLYFNSITHTPFYTVIANYQRILEYLQNNFCDCIIKSYSYPVTYAFLTRVLYLKKQYQDVIHINHLFHSNIMYSAIDFLGLSYFFFCQSLCECKKTNIGKKYAQYAYAIEQLIEQPQNATLLQQYLATDFQLFISSI